MTDSNSPRAPLDAERLAALLDGTLQGSERDALLRNLAVSSDDYDDAVEATLLLADVDGAVVTANASTERRFGIAQRREVRRWLLAAGIAGVGIIGVLTMRGGRDPSPVAFAEQLPPEISYSTDLDREPWSVVRGDGDAVSDAGRAVRAGARLTDLAIAMRSRHPDASAVAIDLANLLAPRAGGAPLAQLMLRLVDDPSEERLRNAAAMLGDLPDADLIALGAWVQAARTVLDADRPDAFDPDAGQRVIEAALPRLSERPDAAQAARDIQALLDSGAPPASVQSALTRLLAEAGR